MVIKKRVVTAPQVDKDSSAAMEVIAVEELSNEEQLLTVGRDKGYVTYDDILAAFPDAEKSIEQRDEVFVALSDTGIQVVASRDEAENQMPGGDADANDYA